MNQNISALAAIAEKKQRCILGLMSGTSLDGLDIALCKISGTGFQTDIVVGHFETVEYEAAFRDALRNICFKETVSLLDLTALHGSIGEKFADLINAFLQKNNIDKNNIDLVACHGQTVYHAAGIPASLQLGDGDHIAVKTGIVTLSDFRQKNIAGGGQGAPLAAYGDLLLFADKETDVLLLNIGGIANLSFLPAGGKVTARDTGPGNTMMNAWIKRHFPGKEYDENGNLAAEGEINRELLHSLRRHAFFDQPFPGTCGPELFNLSFLERAAEESNAENLSVAAVMATLNKFTAETIIDNINKLTSGAYKIYVSGGGIYNRTLMKHLEAGLAKAIFTDTAEKNIPADAKEAVLFALLANECIAGDPTTFLEQNMPAVTMGKISFPY